MTVAQKTMHPGDLHDRPARPAAADRSADRITEPGRPGVALHAGELPEAAGPADGAPATHLPLRNLLLFTREMAMLLTSGSGVVPALAAIGRQMTRPAHRALIAQIRTDIEGGVPLADAITRHPGVFDPVYCAVVAAGEASATLPDTFVRLSEIISRRRAIVNRIIAATAYPALLTLLCSGIVCVLLFFVIPRFGGLFTSLQVPVPTSTAALLTLADALRAHWYLPAAGLALLVTGAVTAVRTDAGRQWLADVQLVPPLLGHLASRLIQARAFRILGLLIQSHVSVLESFELARQVTRSRRFQSLFDSIVEAVSSGGSMSATLLDSGLISPTICQAIHTGEQSGALGNAVSFAADVLDEENEELLGIMTRLLEPVIIIIMGTVVGAVAVSLFMPLFDIATAVR
ncbi:MAG: type II secretion system F family protein [Phycisphaerae bacterium]|nr:type II secretion system F family protein [Phycisphaerae bacterium]